MLSRPQLVFAFLICAMCFPLAAEEPGPTEGVAFFEQHIRPLLIEHCIKCHGPNDPKSGLRLDSFEHLLAGGESGSAIERGNVGDSLLVSAVNYESLEMPPAGKLQPRQIEAIERWVSLGAPWPKGVTIKASSSSTRTITDSDREHWSFRAVEKPTPPTCDDNTWCVNPIDQFVLHRHKAAGLTPSPEADRRTLIRRVYFDVIGLPPSPETINQFIENDSATEYEELVDELLNHPGYGERWARHWLDLVRYAESDGFRADAYRPGAWHYRDYVVRSLNEDKPYNRFVAEQLAGDELWPDDPDAWVGTAYFRLPIYEYNQRDIVTQRQDILNDITDVTADVFLGLGMKCARCHDHKFDAILQKDYFRLQAHFAALMPNDEAILLDPNARSQYDADLATWEAATREVRLQIDEIMRPYAEKQAAAALAKFTPELLAMYHKPEQKRTAIETQLAYFIGRQTREEGKRTPSDKDAKRIDKLKEELAQFDHLKPQAPRQTLTSRDVSPHAPPVRIPGRDSSKPVDPEAIEVLRHLVPTVTYYPTATSTGRRTALVQWLTSPKHPLTSRVAVNRLWQHHFGRGLVATPSDFGTLGSEPSHPELLDWLASTFVENEWRFKEIHRLILTSATYRQSAHHPNAATQEQIDPNNQFTWRTRVRRLDAEQIIDAVNCVAGELESTVGGKSVDSTKRRAIYRKVRRNKPDKLLTLFDAADGINSVPVRSATTTSPQALALLNGEFGLTRAKRMAERIKGRATEATDQITVGYELAFGRLPTTPEVDLALEYFSSADSANPLVAFCHALLNANEFVYVD